LTNYDRQSSHSRETAATGQRGQGQETLPEAGIPLRTGIRDARTGLRQDGHERHVSRPEQKKFVTLENTTRTPRSSWSAQRSALVADVLRRSGRPRVRLQVHGESMLPALWPGDVVEIESCPPEEIWPGEIVLALRHGRFFLHRLVGPCKPSGFQLRGDSMPGADPQFPPEALLGRMVRGADDGRDTRRPGLVVKWFRALGMLLCHCGVARRLALKLHSRRKASARDFRNPEHAAELCSAKSSGIVGSL
jgi:hypothetical protein